MVSIIREDELARIREVTPLPLTITVGNCQYDVPDNAEAIINTLDGKYIRVPLTSIGRIGIVNLDYNWYIKSGYWEERKVKYYKTHPKVCTVCGATEQIHLHNISYDHLGYEGDWELAPLCESCHRVLHSIKDLNLRTKEELADVVSRFFPLCIPRNKPTLARIIHDTVFEGRILDSRYLVKSLRGIPKK